MRNFKQYHWKSFIQRHRSLNGRGERERERERVRE